MPKSRLLFLAPRWPYPPLSGGKAFFLNVALALKEEYELTLLSFCSNSDEMSMDPGDDVFSEIHRVHLPKWRSYLNVTSSLAGHLPLQLAYYRSGQFRKSLKSLLPRHDAVLAYLIRTGQYLTNTKSEIPSLLLMADAISMAYQRTAMFPDTSLFWRFLFRAELNRLSRYERTCPDSFDQTWLHSRVDQRFLALSPKRVRIVPVGIDLDEFPFSEGASGNVIAFVGNMSFSLNVDACRSFLRHIFPALRKRAEVRFRVIGACPSPIQRELTKYDGVEVTGAVRRIADAIDGVFCGVCPVRAGAGIQNKVLNYLALGIPCVTSKIGHEGIDALAGRDLLVYEDEGQAADFILRLYRDPSLRSELAVNGRRFIETAHDWKAIHRAIRGDVHELFASRRARVPGEASSEEIGRPGHPPPGGLDARRE